MNKSLLKQDYVNPEGDIKISIRMLNDPLAKWNATITIRYKDEFWVGYGKKKLKWTKVVLFSNSNSFSYMMRRGKIYVQKKFEKRWKRN